MPTPTVQVPVLMSKAQKLRLARKAKVAKLTMGELLRQGAERFAPGDDPTVLEHMAQHVTRATTKAIRSIDHTLALVAASEQRIEQLTRSTSKKGYHGTHRTRL